MCTANTTPTLEDFQFLMSAFTATTTTTMPLHQHVLQQQQQQSRRKRRGVRFAPYVFAADSGPLSKDELPELWYTQSDLATFKSEAKQIVKKTQRMTSATSPCSSSSLLLRGLEHCTPNRQKYRYMCIKATMSAYKRGMSTGQISYVSMKCTQWCCEIAFLQACYDFATIYQPNMLFSIQKTLHDIQNIQPLSQFPFMMTTSSSSSNSRKRTASSESSSSPTATPPPEGEGEEGGRRVRQRRTMVY